MSTGRGNDCGASGYASPANEKITAMKTMALPTPSLFPSRFAYSAPTIDPAEPTANTAPAEIAERCSVRTM
jgi:hypothetical protein